MKEMSLIEHLDELRTRLIRVLIILVVAFTVSYVISDDIALILLKPLREAMGENGKIIYLGILDKLIAQFQLAFLAALIISAPLWFREAWLFIKPALYEHEVNAVRPFMWVGFVLFVLGVCFGYFVVFPFTFSTLLDLGVKDVEAYLNLKEYLILSVKVLVFLGLMFQLPNIMLILGFMEVVTKYTLKQYRRYVYVLFSVIAAVITPPDVLTMMIVWVPLIVLYEIGVLAVTFIVHPYLHRKYA
jgi:sec-independent protein translocase protein TatC